MGPSSKKSRERALRLFQLYRRGLPPGRGPRKMPISQTQLDARVFDRCRVGE
jgi:hypothetical protein